MKTLVLIAALALTGCASQQKVAESLKGTDIAEIVRQYGPPTSKTDDANGGEIYTYASQGSNPFTGQAMMVYEHIYVGPDRKVYHYMKNSENVAPTQVQQVKPYKAPPVSTATGYGN
jgi:hypothetical protein